MNRPLARLCRSLNYEFSNLELLNCALTHRSAGNRNNERLEFLGDAILGTVIAEALYNRFPEANEGQLSRLRASLVKRESLAKLARSLDLGSYLVLGGGELKSGGHARSSILADALEAVFGSVFLDAAFETCRSVILSIFGDQLESASLQSIEKDPKTRLQEYLQSRQLPLPEYQVLDVQGAAHAQSFRVRCSILGVDTSVIGEGTSRRRAEQNAAEKAFELLRYDAS